MVQPLFKPIGRSDTTIALTLDGQPIAARAGETVAAALLRAGISRFRTTPVSGAPRLPFCMIGHCFDCLIQIDGLGSRQACLTTVQDGMRLRTQLGAATTSQR